MININIDLRQSNDLGGIANYIHNISSRLISTEKYMFSGCAFFYRGRNVHDFNWFPGRKKLSFMPERIIHADGISLPLSYECLFNSRAALNVFFSYRLPHVRFNAPVVSTIHDIILLKAKTESQEIIDKHLRILEDTIAKSDYILTVSEASRKDIIEYFNISHEKIHIVHNGIDHRNFSAPLDPEKMRSIRKKYDLPDRYILNFGVYRRHKNIERLIEAYSLLSDETHRTVKIVLTTSNADIDRLIEICNIKDSVVVIGFVAEEDKAPIFKMADIVYYASLYEGFGVPVIEAQAAGTPVITSDTSSLPEASGPGGAAFVNPYSELEIASAIERILSDKEYAASLISNGYKNSRQYTWERSVEEFYTFLNSINIANGR